jgi:hypothetical protein
MMQKLKINKNVINWTMSVLSALLLILVFNAQAAAQTSDPLPSWNEGELKIKIVRFITSVTTKGSPNFVPSEQRIATFDQDGTLWSEQPVVQGMFLMYKLELMAAEDPSIRTKQPFKAAFENDKEYLKSEGMPAILELFSATHSGMSQEQFVEEVEAFFSNAKYPKLNAHIGQIVYKPMIELLDYLRANNFKTYICSGGGIDFMRVLSDRLYGIPPEQVIGSSMKKELSLVDGKWILLRTGKLNSFNDKEVKPMNIDLHIGERPLLAMGNVRSSGDIGMLHYSQGRKGPSLQLLINHDDEKREFAYSEDDNASLRAAKVNHWLVVSIKNDWKSVFQFSER